jgi:hypothetical protein
MPDDDRPEDRLDYSSLERFSANAPPPREKRGSALTKAIAVLAPLIILAAVPWILVTRFLKESATRPEPTVSASPTPSASPSPSESASPALGKGTYVVSGLQGAACLRIHTTPGTGTPIVDCLQAGIEVTSDGQSAEADGLPWLRIHDPIVRKDGWAASTYLRKVG